MMLELARDPGDDQDENSETGADDREQHRAAPIPRGRPWRLSHPTSGEATAATTAAVITGTTMT